MTESCSCTRHERAPISYVLNEQPLFQAALVALVVSGLLLMGGSLLLASYGQIQAIAMYEMIGAGGVLYLLAIALAAFGRAVPKQEVAPSRSSPCQAKVNWDLYRAVEAGKVNEAARAIQQGADVECAPLLHIAVERDDHSLIALLVAEGASPSQKDYRGLSAYQVALRAGNGDVQQYLLNEAGADATEN